jgi:hypothetical protein
VAVKGDEIRARQVANQIALRDAVTQYGVSKIFTFHTTVKSAASFVADGNEGVRTHLPDFSGLHVSGTMPTARRERVMKEFRSAPRAVMSNARCLTEGVDVPAVDMVAFLSPRKSKVDIVQAIGRAMRKSDGKETGYILIPLYLEQKAGESIEEAVARANFEEVWDILQSLQEQDEVLAELIREAAQAKGRGKGFDDSRFSDRIAFTGPVLALESIRQAVTTKVLERLESSWDFFFGQLLKFKEENGHCLVTKNNSLGAWVGRQRHEKKKGILTQYKIDKLNQVEFCWDADRTKPWDYFYHQLVEFKKIYSHCNVPAKHAENQRLAHWVSSQRARNRLGSLDKNYKDLLDTIGFSWSLTSPKKTWETFYIELSDYKKREGHANVPVNYKDKQLANWLRKQRELLVKDRLPLENRNRLLSLGVIADPFNSYWDEQFAKLVTFSENHGHTKVPARWNEDRKLSTWVDKQRQKYKSGLLSDAKIERLISIGFVFSFHEDTWEKKYSELEDYYKRTGHSDVPARWKENKALATWVGVQRINYKKGSLSNERIQLLERFNFLWDERGIAWDKNYASLKEFYDRFAHTRVPRIWPENTALPGWMQNLRTLKKKELLTSEQIESLLNIGFSFHPHDDQWNQSYNSLKDLIQNNSSFNIREDDIPKSLKRWLFTQQQGFFAGKLSNDRLSKLRALGFEWKVR